ncbi:hypothetical protein [Terracoccus luteus]|uniref:hypothetical protein n=1 Tax=Terracoccus luteus TaxID=53356 RepID=UPI0011C4279A|nr:hypothetical protein [Terracoccus luteus]
MGVDTIALRGRVHPDTLGSLPRQRIRRDIDVVTGAAHETETSAEVWVADGVMIRADHWRGRPEVMLECSVPNLLYGDNTVAAPVAEVQSAVEDLWGLVGEHVQWECEPEDLTLMRLDVVRDFQGVTQANAHLAGLARVPAQRAATHGYMSSKSPGVQTLYRETGRWQARLYLRSALYAGSREGASSDVASHAQQERLAHALENQDRLRYELQLRRRGLEEEGVASVGELSPTRLWTLAERYFHRCRFGTPVGSVRQKTLVAVGELIASKPANHVRAMLGQLWLDALMPSAFDGATVTKYRNEAKNLDLYASELVDPWGVGPLRALDFDAGAIVELAHVGVVSAAP